MANKIRVVCATRLGEADFWAKSALGRSLTHYRLPFIDLRLFAQNSRGLSTVYNIAIDESLKDPAVLVFLHDDAHLCDFYWFDYLLTALAVFDVVGLAGNRRRLPRQPAWSFIDERFTWDAPQNLSGIVGHGRGFPPAQISFYGPPRQEVKLLDGLMLVARSETLHSRQLRFDERFAFHFYDMDFCRQAEVLGLKMGTWSISIVHESGGNFGAESWRQAYATYLQKWTE
jgi:GT2 family glycosyltransferase